MRKRDRFISLFATTILLLQLINPVLSLAAENSDDHPPQTVEEPSQGESTPVENVEEPPTQEIETPPEEDTESEEETSSGDEQTSENEEQQVPPEEGEKEVTPEEEEVTPDENKASDEEVEQDEEGKQRSEDELSDSNTSEEDDLTEAKNKEEETRKKDKVSNREEAPRKTKKAQEPSFKIKQQPKVDKTSPAEILPIPKVFEFQEEILGIITEADFANHVISSTNPSTYLHINLTEKAKVKGIVWDALHPNKGIFKNGDLGAVIDEELEHWDSLSYGPGEEQLYISTAYCPYGRSPSLCAEDLPDGVYSIKLSAILEDRFIDGEIEVGPLFIKETSATIAFDAVDGPIDDTEITGAISDKFVDWASTVKDVYDENYDVNDYLFASYQVTDGQNEIVKEDDLTLNEDGTFAIPLGDLDADKYTITVLVEDAGENAPAEENITFELGHDGIGEAKGLSNSDETIEASETNDSEELTDPDEPVELTNTDEKSELAAPDSLEEMGEDVHGQEISFDETLEVSSNEFIQVKNTSISLKLPADIPKGTYLTMKELKNEDATGDVVDVILQLPEGHEDYEGTFLLTLGINEDFMDEDIAIFYFNENIGDWENIGGEVDQANQTITVPVHDNLSYGVFANSNEGPIRDSGENDGGDTEEFDLDGEN